MKEITVKCEKLNDQGYGLIQDNKRIYQVPNLLPQETATVSLFNNGFGRVKEWKTYSDQRAKPKCSRYHECGGCQLQHFSYENQLIIKTNAVISAFNKQKIEDVTILPIIGAKSPYHYRNKNQMVISEKNRKIMSGFYQENTHFIVNIDECAIQNDTANQIIKSARQLLMKHKIKAYDEKSGEGLIRHILVRVSDTTHEVLVVLVTKEEVFPGRNNFTKELRLMHPEITTIVQNINPRATSIVLGDFERVLFGPGFIKDQLLEKTFMISSKTFYQVNSKQTAILYKKALEIAKPRKDEIMIDAFSGVGTIGILFAEHVKQVYGVESNKDSVKNAIMNSRLNQVHNIRFVNSDASEYLDKLVDDKVSVDIFLVDPPRAGLGKPFMDKIISLKPKKFVYISCNPETFAEDVAYLRESGYNLQNVQPIDMFPQTNHVESVSLLSLK